MATRAKALSVVGVLGYAHAAYLARCLYGAYTYQRLNGRAPSLTAAWVRSIAHR